MDRCLRYYDRSQARRSCPEILLVRYCVHPCIWFSLRAAGGWCLFLALHPRVNPGIRFLASDSESWILSASGTLWRVSKISGRRIAPCFLSLFLQSLHFLNRPPLPRMEWFLYPVAQKVSICLSFLSSTLAERELLPRLFSWLTLWSPLFCCLEDGDQLIEASLWRRNQD